jgi:hypothetical protein
MKKDQSDLTENLKKLSSIADWFEQQEEVDVETGLSKVKEAATLIKVTKSRLKEIENEFEEIKAEMEEETEEEN